jgi:hypothetical protein
MAAKYADDWSRINYHNKFTKFYLYSSIYRSVWSQIPFHWWRKIWKSSYKILCSKFRILSSFKRVKEKSNTCKCFAMFLEAFYYCDLIYYLPRFRTYKRQNYVIFYRPPYGQVKCRRDSCNAFFTVCDMRTIKSRCAYCHWFSSISFFGDCVIIIF